MTTQRLNLVPPRALRNLRPKLWGGGYTFTTEWALGVKPVKGDFEKGSMLGRRTNLRVPFDTFMAVLVNLPAGNAINDSNIIRINDGRNTVTYEFDSGGGVTPGNVAIVYTGAETASQIKTIVFSAIAQSAYAKVLDLEARIWGNDIFLFSHRSHPGMYGWGADDNPTDPFYSNIPAWVGLVGWGRWDTIGTQYFNARNAWGRFWFPIHWGLKYGWAAVEPIIGMPPPQ